MPTCNYIIHREKALEVGGFSSIYERAGEDLDFQALAWTPGLGVRYFSPVGPIRVDVAFPVDKRETDSSFQIYIALGQPF